MKRLCAALTIFLVAPLYAQQPEVLSDKEALQMFTQAADLMESTAVAVPGLGRAGAPLIEDVRQTIKTMRSGLSPQNAGLNYQLLSSVRGYLTLYELAPKPDNLPEESMKQFAMLRAMTDRIQTNFRALLLKKDRELSNSDRDNLKRYAEENLTLGPAAAGRARVVFLGDSITDGWRLNEYFPDRDFVNRGISGQITGQMLGRTMADVINLKPAAVLVLAGTNDIGRGVPLQVIEQNLTMIAELAQANGIKVFLASVLPVSDYHKDQDPNFERTRLRPPNTIATLNDWIRRFCDLHNCAFVDYYSRTVDSSGFLKAEYSDDGLHPNSMGYRIMAPVAVEAINRVLIGAAQPEAKKKRRPF